MLGTVVESAIANIAAALRYRDIGDRLFSLVVMLP
jgi:hypothetical protein